MTAIHFTRNASLGSISAFALCLALGAPVALAQEVLPTIEVGRKTTTPVAARAPARRPRQRQSRSPRRSSPGQSQCRIPSTRR